MSERPNKATICSIVFLDLPELSSKPVFQQVGDRELLKSITDEALRDVAPDDRVLIENSNGMVIALFGAPEAALFIAMMIRDAVTVRVVKAADEDLVEDRLAPPGNLWGPRG